MEFVGATTLLQSLWRTAAGDAVVARLTLLPPRSPTGLDRRELAGRLRADIGASLGLPQPPEA